MEPTLVTYVADYLSNYTVPRLVLIHAAIFAVFDRDYNILNLDNFSNFLG